MGGYRAKFFKPDEFKCRCCGSGSGAIDPVLLLALDTLRSRFGEALVVNSGYRCPRHNSKVGGAKNSRHLTGHAADVRPANRASLDDFKRLVQIYDSELSLRAHGWEILEYPTFVHIGSPV